MQIISNIFCLAILANLLLAIRAHVTDRTREEMAIGKDVTEAVVDFISKSNIFSDDHRFLLRIAYFESEFGTDPNTFADKNGTEYHGGIWQVDRSTFIDTQNPSLSSKFNEIEEEFGIKYSSLIWKDCRKPLISGLAARLALNITGESIPDTLKAQGEFWYKHYNSAAESGTAEEFVNKSKAMEKLNKCRGRMDLVIVMDGSGSVDTEEFKNASEFVSNLILTFSPENVDLGYIVYSGNSKIVFRLNSNLSLESMNAKVLNESRPGGGTDTSGAIITAIELFDDSTQREGVPKIILVFTDGISNEPVETSASAAIAKTYGITIFAIGIGSNLQQVQLDELFSIAQGDETHVLTPNSYEELAEMFEWMNVQTCRITQTPGIGCLALVADILEEEERRYYCYESPSEGLTVIIRVKEGSFEAFYSYSIENPSSALNDGIINGWKYIAYKGQGSNKVCVTVEGIDRKNNFTIEAEKGNTETCRCTYALGNFCGHRSKDNCLLRGNCSEGDLYFCSKQYEQATIIKKCTSECFEHYLGNDYCYPILNH